METDRELKELCWMYINHIYKRSHPETMTLKELTSFSISDKQRSELHNAILNHTGLSAFDFGGLPCWYEIDDVDETSQTLYNALCKKIAQKSAGDKK
jgi:hypothetical protein